MAAVLLAASATADPGPVGTAALALPVVFGVWIFVHFLRRCTEALKEDAEERRAEMGANPPEGGIR